MKAQKLCGLGIAMTAAVVTAGCSGHSGAASSAGTGAVTGTVTTATSSATETSAPVATSSPAAPTGSTVTGASSPTSASGVADPTRFSTAVAQIYRAAIDDSVTRGGKSHFVSAGLGSKDVAPLVGGDAVLNKLWGSASTTSPRPLMCGAVLGTNGAAIGEPRADGGGVKVYVRLFQDTTTTPNPVTITLDPASGKVTGFSCSDPQPDLPGLGPVAGYFGTLVGLDPAMDEAKYFTPAYRAGWPSGTTYVGPKWSCSQNGIPYWIATQEGGVTGNSVEYRVGPVRDTVDAALGQISNVSCG
ncbi:hypothetical protein [Catenulispora subtropica]|uniref:Lipoprotein n=1 Tax=Catenulispora subtropica TaxID=450798 RepID=A0ABP5EGU0_9ACTN